jgi:hypothetical protein
MVPLSARRHRLHTSEIPEVIVGLELLLRRLSKERREAERAEIAFRCLCRLLETGAGRPKYPEFTWEYLDSYLETVKYALGTQCSILRKPSGAH